MEMVKDYIIRQVAANKLSQDEAKVMLKELKSKQSKDNGEIAIIGMACRFPGAKNPQEYWNNLINGVNCIGELSEQRKKDNYTILSNPLFRHTIINADLSEEDLTEGNIEFVKSGYIDEIDKFDAGFFRIPRREAKFIDPIQRVFMEVAYEALEDAGYGGKKIYGTKTGVFVGRDNTNGSIYKMVTEQDEAHLTGSWTGILATRISYIFNLRGSGIVVDTACSSGATAIHQACQALRNKECDYAIAGGIHVDIQHVIKGQKTSMAMVESGDSKVRTFDKNANGTVWGEGVGVLFLKPLSKAIADRDSIYAVIKGSAVNNDGTSNGITAPNAEAQEDVIIQAWKDAKVNPESISYIEAHGTGTVLGDPIEIKGIVNAFERYTDKKQFCGIGSVKTNIGHLVGASGLASIIKVVLSMKYGILPATINFEEPNPYINFNESPVYVNDSLKTWESSNSPRRAGVSSFGFSGTNCHIVVEQAPESENLENQSLKEAQILTISARSENVLMDFVNKYADYLDRGTKDDLRDICYTANTGRGHFDCRIALVIRSYEELKSKVSVIKEKGFKHLNEQGVFYGHNKLVARNKKSVDYGEITEEQKGKISLEAVNLLNKAVTDENTINELCRLYVEGAEFEWDMLYTGQVLKRVHLPVYPLERIRLWANPREFEVKVLGRSKSSTQNNTHITKPKAEEQLVEVWQEVLGVENLEPDNNFFDLSGDSLKAMQIVSLAEKQNIYIAVTDIFKYRTIADILENVDYNKKEGDASPEEGREEENKEYSDGSKVPVGTDIPDEMELKIELQNDITTYLCHSLALCVILTDDRLLPWYYEHFVNIFSMTDENDYTMLEFLEVRSPYKDVMVEVYMGYELLDEVTDIVGFIIKKINKGYYMIVHVDEYYHPNKEHYKKDHFVHQSIVYGYSNTERKLKAIGFDNQGIFTKISFDYDIFAQSFEIGKLYYKESAPWAKTNAIEMLKLRDFKKDYPFDLSRFLTKLGNYIYSIGDYSIIYSLRLYREMLNEDHVEYGFNVYDVVVRNLENFLYGNITIDYRAIHLLFEHKKAIYKRLSYIVSLYSITGETAELIQEYSKIAERLNTLRLEFIEAIANRREDDISPSQDELALAIRQFIENIDLIKKDEQMLLIPIYEQLKMLLKTS